MVGISTDSIEKQKRFRDEHGLPYPLLSDEGGKVAKLYGGTVPILGTANRATYVVDRDGTIVAIVTGSDAINPSGAIASCPVHGRGRP